VVSGDFDGDGRRDDLACMYDYPNAAAGVWTFLSSGSSFRTESWYQSGAWNWEAPRCNGRFVASNFVGDGRSDIFCSYDYDDAGVGAWGFASTGSSFSVGLYSRPSVLP
jgi:hypothetical protein